MGYRQEGVAVLGTIVMVAIVGIVMMGYTKTAMQQRQDVRIYATAASINYLANAQSSHYDSVGAWAVDLDQLSNNGFLPRSAGTSLFRNNNAVGNPYTFVVNGRFLHISTEMTDQVQARRVALAVGSNASALLKPEEKTVLAVYAPPASASAPGP
jgi:type II secretory pathway pseudopilin PulG